MPNPSDTPDPSVPRALAASVLVLMRFSLRAIILVLFALAGKQGFGRTLEGMLSLAAFYCVVAATIRREPVFGTALTHFDEAAGYAAIAGLARLIA